MFRYVATSILPFLIALPVELSYASDASSPGPQPAPATTPTEVYFFGGGGEGSQSENMFDGGFNSVRAAAEARGWTDAYQVDIRHQSTAVILKNLSADSHKKVTDFSPENFKAQLESLTTRISKRKFPAKTQLLIVVDTHGLPKDSSGSNEISTAFGNKTELTKPLRKLIEAASQRGVTLGIILGNCYSGDARHDFGSVPGVCIVSASAPNRVGTLEFRSMFRQIGNSPDLETAFLDARKSSSVSIAQPGINTTPGYQTERDLDVFRNLQTYPVDRLSAENDRLCSDNDMKLDRIVELARKARTGTEQSWLGFWSHAGDVAAARDLRDGLLARARALERGAMPGTGQYGLDANECIAKTVRATMPSAEAALLTSKCSALHNFSQTKLWKMQEQLALIESSSGDPVARQQVIAKMKNAIAETSKFLMDPEFKSAQREIAKSRMEMKNWESDERNLELVDHERRLYDSFYRYHSRTDKGPNPCRDFKLK